MTWDARNQLCEVTAVKREDGPDDSELYRYDGEGQRVRKVRVSQARGRTLTAEVRYLPGLEVHRNEATGEVRHVLTIEAGRSSVRLLHWESGKPDGIENDQLRYSLSDHLGSSTLELDQDAKLISHEGYYPFGGTAWWAARNTVEANYKTVRYSGKERDATGLYYYGFRYYAPWLQRWVNPDPAGPLQDLNLYQFVGRSPVSMRERDGRVYEGVDDWVEQAIESGGRHIFIRGINAGVQQTFNVAFRWVQEVYETAGEMVRNDPQLSEPIMQSFFGPAHESVKDHLLNSWQQSAALAAKYQSADGASKMAGFISHDPADIAGVVKGDPHGRIFVNLKVSDADKFNKAIGHEITHLRAVDSFQTSGADTVDYFYLNGARRDWISRDDASRYVTGEQGFSDVALGGGLTPREAYLIDQPNFIQFVRDRSPAGAVANLADAVHAFNVRPGLAADMTATNADSVLFSAVALHRSEQLATRKREAHGYRSYSSITKRQ